MLPPEPGRDRQQRRSITCQAVAWFAGRSRTARSQMVSPTRTPQWTSVQGCRPGSAGEEPGGRVGCTRPHPCRGCQQVRQVPAPAAAARDEAAPHARGVIGQELRCRRRLRGVVEPPSFWSCVARVPPRPASPRQRAGPVHVEGARPGGVAGGATFGVDGLRGLQPRPADPRPRVLLAVDGVEAGATGLVFLATRAPLKRWTPVAQVEVGVR
jgi:hypothetical protein